MTERNPAIFIQASSHPAEDTRRGLGALLDQAGVIGVNDLAVVQHGTPNMSVDVPDGRVAIKGSEATYQGVYLCENRGVTNLAISASDPTNPRIDLIVAKVQDAAYSGVTNAWSLAVVTGTPAGSPVAPAAPNNSIILAQVAVAALAASIVTANITDKRTFAGGLHGVTPCASSALRPSSPFDNQLVYQVDKDWLIRWDAGASKWYMVEGGGTYTPTLVNFTIGTGGSAQNTAKWFYGGGMLTVVHTAILGTSGQSVATTVTATFPSTFTPDAAYVVNWPLGRARMNAAGAGNVGEVTWQSATTVQYTVENVAGTYPVLAAIGASIPGVWAAGNQILSQFACAGLLDVTSL